MTDAANSQRGPLLIVAAWFPPSVSGSSVLSRNLWSAWPADDLAVLTHRPIGARTDPQLTLPGVRVRMIEGGPFQDARAAAHLDPLAAGFVRKQIIAAAREFKPRAIWANWPSTAFLLGSWQAARSLRLPLYVHLHDTWSESFRGKRRYVETAAASLFERRLLKDAARVMTITDSAREHYLSSQGVDSYVLPHCIPDADLAAAQPYESRRGAPVELHYAGSIYPLMNQDAVQNAAAALEQCRSETVLQCYTPNSEASLQAIGIGGPKVQIKFGSKQEVMAAQRAADILIMPLAFKSNNPTEIRTVFPTKLLEYFVSGRPILVHAPSDAWVSRDARRHGWGEVVDQPDAGAVAAAVDRLVENPQHARGLVEAAQQAAGLRAASRVASDLRAELERITSQSRAQG